MYLLSLLKNDIAFYKVKKKWKRKEKSFKRRKRTEI